MKQNVSIKCGHCEAIMIVGLEYKNSKELNKLLDYFYCPHCGNEDSFSYKYSSPKLGEK